MKWIKASDRLPDTRVIVRWVSPAGGPYIEIGDGDWIKGYKTAGHYAPDSLEEVEWLDESTPSASRGLQDRNFMVRLKANIDRRMTETGVKEMMLEGINTSKKSFSEIWTAFFESLEDITLETLQGKEPNPISSRGLTEEEMQHMAIEKYCTPFGRPNPETYAFIEGLKAASLPLQSKVEGEQWVSIDNGLPEYNSSVWFYCPKFKTVLDGIFYEEDAFKRSKVFIRVDGSHFLLNVVSHWKYNHVPAPPKQ